MFPQFFQVFPDFSPLFPMESTGILGAPGRGTPGDHFAVTRHRGEGVVRGAQRTDTHQEMRHLCYAGGLTRENRKRF